MCSPFELGLAVCFLDLSKRAHAKYNAESPGIPKISALTKGPPDPVKILRPIKMRLITSNKKPSNASKKIAFFSFWPICISDEIKPWGLPEVCRGGLFGVCIVSVIDIAAAFLSAASTFAYMAPQFGHSWSGTLSICVRK